jgi:hypothetical protein
MYLIKGRAVRMSVQCAYLRWETAQFVKSQQDLNNTVGKKLFFEEGGTITAIKTISTRISIPRCGVALLPFGWGSFSIAFLPPMPHRALS